MMLRRLQPTKSLSYVTRRSFLTSLRDKVSSSIDSSQEKKQKEFFDKQLNMMVASPQYTMRMWIDSQKEIAELSGGTGWRSYVAKAMPDAGGNKAMLEAMKREIDILEAFPDGVKDDKEPLTGTVKTVVSESMSTSKEELNFLLKKYDAQKAFAKFLRERSQNGLSMPGSFVEAQELMQKEGAKENVKSLKPKIRHRRNR